MSKEACATERNLAPSRDNERRWILFKRTFYTFALLAFLVATFSLQPRLASEFTLDAVAFFSLAVTCLAVAIAIEIFLRQAKNAAVEKNDNNQLLNEIKKISSGAADSADLAAKKADTVVRILIEAQRAKLVTSIDPRDVQKIVESYAAPTVELKQVLWVDDNVESIHLERKALKASGVSTVWLRTTEQALDALRGNSFDAVITDMKRPEGHKEGLSLLTEMRARGFTNPVIVYAGPRIKNHLEEILRHDGFGATYDPIELYEMVMEAIS